MEGVVATLKVLLTGHDGYIGSVLGPKLIAAGHHFVCLDTFYFGDGHIDDGHDQTSTLRKDIRDIAEDDVRGVDVVIHLAALSNDPLGDLDAALTLEINHMASVRLAQIAREVGVKRFLYASSCSMYGAAGQGLIAEETPLRPLTPYAVSKARTEEDLAKLADSDFSPVLMRNATAYGVSPRLRADLVLNNLVCWAYTTGEVRLTSDGTAWRPVVHVEDIAHAFEVAVAAPRRVVHNQAFNVGVAGENYQVRELAHIVEDTVPGAKVVYATGGGPDQRSYRVDFSKLSTSFPDFKPRWNARLGAKELYSLFQKVGLKVEDFQGPRYVRLEQLKRLLETGRLQPNLRWKL